MAKYKRKYEKGACIMSVGQFEALGCEWFIINGKTTHRSFIESFQYRTLKNLILLGLVYVALPSGTMDKLKESGILKGGDVNEN